jgi:hypothetical protein
MWVRQNGRSNTPGAFPARAGKAPGSRAARFLRDFLLRLGKKIFENFKFVKN